MPAPRYTTRFELSAHVHAPTPSQSGEIKASLNRLKPLLPPEINADEHPTIVYVVGNLFVAGTINRNGDGVSIQDGVKMYKAFEGQPINIEHNRGSVVGYIVHAGLSEFGTDRLITEEEALSANQPYNIAIAVALWKIVDKELVQYVLQSAEPGSELRDTLSFSFEVGFDSYAVVTMPKGTTNLNLATRIIGPDSSEFNTWDKRLKVNKGLGSFKDEDVSRVLIWPIYPLGGGIVAVPAGAVKGLIPVTTETPEITEVFEEEEESEAGLYTYSSTQVTLSSPLNLSFVNFGNEIPKENLYLGDEKDNGKYGVETEPHITVVYGIKGTDVKPVQECLAGCGPIKARLGKLSLFSNSENPYDVLKVDVESDDLHRLNALIKVSCDCDITYPDYHPHLTIAYVQKGKADAYIGDSRFEGMELTFGSLTFSPSTGDRTEIDLTLVSKNSAAKELLKVTGGEVVAASDAPVLIANESCVSPEGMRGITIDNLQIPNQEKSIPTRLAIAYINQIEKTPYIKDLSASVSFSTNPCPIKTNNPMKLEDLKQAVAAVKSVEDLPAVMANVASFVDIIAKASEEQAVARAAAEQTAKNIEAKLAEVTKAAEANVAEVTAKLSAITKAHEELLAAHQAAAAEQAFQTRMASVEEVFAFDDAARADVIEEIKACVDDAAFTKWMARAQRMYKGFAKANLAVTTTKASDDKDEDDKNGDKDKEEACATAAKEVIASAAAAVVDPAINNIIDASAANESLFERLKKVAAKNARIGGETVEALTAKANAVKQTS